MPVQNKFIVGFTGTRKGMTENQKSEFSKFIWNLNPYEFHHGDCVGADYDAHQIVRSMCPQCKIILHPGDTESKRANCVGDVRHHPILNKDRNFRIIKDTNMLIACPNTEEEIVRSGTWHTVRLARRLRRPVWIFKP